MAPETASRCITLRRARTATVSPSNRRALARTATRQAETPPAGGDRRGFVGDALSFEDCDTSQECRKFNLVPEKLALLPTLFSGTRKLSVSLGAGNERQEAGATGHRPWRAGAGQAAADPVEANRSLARKPQRGAEPAGGHPAADPAWACGASGTPNLSRHPFAGRPGLNLAICENLGLTKDSRRALLRCKIKAYASQRDGGISGGRHDT